MKLTIGTRGSLLALWQAEHIKDELKKISPNVEVEIKVIKTTGDKILDVPLAKIGGKGLFTKEIEEAMLSGDVDIAVHSLKDVPVEFLPGLGLSAITKRDDSRDAYLSVKYPSLKDIPKNGVVGTTSLRRRMQVLKHRPDLKVMSLRGNVQTRIDKLKRGEFDAILLAYAGIKRLDIKDAVEYVLPIDKDVMVPPMGQAALGIECKIGSAAFELTSKLNDKKAVIESTIEREFVKELEGGCQAPIGINAELNDESIFVRALIGMPDGSEFIEFDRSFKAHEYKIAGKELAEEAKSKGAIELIARSIKLADKILV
jgi:hydroxymethylbilane synthase